MNDKWKLVDIFLERSIIGKVHLRLMFISNGGNEFKYQEPFDLSEDIEVTQHRLLELAKGIHAYSKKISEIES